MKKYKHLEVAIFSEDMMEDSDLSKRLNKSSTISLGIVRVKNEYPEGLTEERIKEAVAQATDVYLRSLKHNKIIE